PRRREISECFAAAAGIDGGDRSGPRRQKFRDRRSVRGDARANRRLLPDPCQGSRPGDRHRCSGSRSAHRNDRGPAGQGSRGPAPGIALRRAKKVYTKTGSRKEEVMSGVRVLVGTRKGAFILTSDAKRERWDISGPHFAGWEIYHLKGSPADPNRLYASQTSGWFGQIIQRSDDGGKSWHQPGTPPGEPTTTPEGMPKGES